MRVTAGLVIAVAITGMLAQDAIYGLGVRLFGPPRVVMAESYAQASADDAAPFDHSLLNKVVADHVDDAGWIDYAAIVDDPTDLDAYIALLADADLTTLDRDEKLAFLINAYNAFTLRLIVDYYDQGKLKSIRDIPDGKRWDHVRWDIAGTKYSLNQIEHEWIRKKFKEPRIHFALVCAAESCPILRDEAFTGDELESQLASQTEYTHAHPRWYKYDKQRNVLHLTALYQWYGGDFEQVAGSVLQYVAAQSDEVKQAIDAGKPPKLKYIEYSWRLNDKRYKP